MSETQRKLFNKRAGGLWIAGAFVFWAVVFVVSVLSPSPPRPEPVKIDTLPAPRRDALPPPVVFDVFETYYRTIIDNNLFRPLGWTLPRPIEPYCLLGTKLASDETTPHQQFYNPPLRDSKVLCVFFLTHFSVSVMLLMLLVVIYVI